MVVTSVIPFDKKRSRVLFDEDLVLLLYLSEIRRYGLEEGCQVPEETCREIVEQVLKKRAREKVISLLKVSDKTELELRRALEKGLYPAEVIEDAIELVKRHRYIDDDAYGQRYAERSGRTKSRCQIAAELQKKGLERQQIKDILEECVIDEEEQIRSSLRKKGYSPEHPVTAEKYQKLAASFVRKGYSFDMVNRILKELCENW